MAERWREIAGELRAEIRDGKHLPGQGLPTSGTLMKRYGVARQTVQHAIDQLRAEGLVITRPGAGWFVRKRLRRVCLARTQVGGLASRVRPVSVPADAHEAPWRVEVDVTVSVEVASRRVASELGIDRGDEVFVRTGKLGAGGEVAQILTSYLPRELTRDTAIEREDDGQRGVHNRLEEAGYHIVGFVERVSASPATDAESRELGIGQGASVLRINRTAHSVDRALETTYVRASAERFELLYELPAG